MFWSLNSNQTPLHLVLSPTQQKAPDYSPACVQNDYEISFNRYFYKPKALRSLEEIRADMLAVKKEATSDG